MLLYAGYPRDQVSSGCFSQLFGGAVSAGGDELKGSFRGLVHGIYFAVVGSWEVEVWVQGVWSRGLLESVAEEAETFCVG
jgi:hypothetical protein